MKESRSGNAMNRRQLLTMAGAATTGAVLATAGNVASADHHEKAHGHKDADYAVAVMRPTKGNKTRGTVTFRVTKKGVQINANINGLTPNQKHAIHIHEFGDIRATDGTGTGGHYNPEGHDHSLPEKGDKRHAGDLGNLQADAEGKAKYKLVVDNITINGHKNPIAGRGVIIHEKADDGGQPTGNAGPRISQGTIGIGKMPEPKKKEATENSAKAPASNVK